MLRSHLGLLGANRVTQRSAAGETSVAFEGETVWLERTGTTGGDLDDVGEMLSLLGLSGRDIGFDAVAVGGREAPLRPAVTDIGVPQLMLPLASPHVVASLRTPSSVPYADGVYCFAPLGAGRIKARFFAPGVGVGEDPATGSAAAGLGVYFGARAGELAFEIEQGAEIARPSFISVQARNGSARVGGQVRLVAEATLHV